MIRDRYPGQTLKSLSQLIEALDGARPLHGAGADPSIGRIAIDSRDVRPGDLFVAIRGTSTDSHHFVAEVAARGAAAVVVEREVADPGVPVVRVPDSRRALAELSAAWYGHPAGQLPLVGITGTLGKTSVLSMLESILERAGRKVGTIGSLGIRVTGEPRGKGHTVPPPLILQRALAEMRDEGADLAMMEVTTHALSQQRVHGLRFALGIFANLVPMEHMEYHGTFEDYVAVKTQYFDFLAPGAPIVFPIGDRAVRAQVEERRLNGVSCGGDPGAMLHVERRSMTTTGSDLLLHVRQPLPRWDGGRVEPYEFPLHIRLLGRSNINNATLAATAALCLGADAASIQQALATIEPPRRRMEIIHEGRFTVLDDTVGHPDSITAVFEVAEQLPHRRLHVVFVIRGQRGEMVNRQAADALAIWAERVPVSTLVVTRSADAADERNRVSPEEREAFLGGLREGGVEFRETEELRDAIDATLDRVGEGDLLLLLGAQGMDAGAGMVWDWMRNHDAGG
jgi:UDP-N-acetylmuramoyl-L-alanyl-D-glutamate--2,6-diaminopimelate ligase